MQTHHTHKAYVHTHHTNNACKRQPLLGSVYSNDGKSGPSLRMFYNTLNFGVR
jgi:hypothetical protein